MKNHFADLALPRLFLVWFVRQGTTGRRGECTQQPADIIACQPETGRLYR